jgi:hypothetical protein
VIIAYGIAGEQRMNQILAILIDALSRVMIAPFDKSAQLGYNIAERPQKEGGESDERNHTVETS